MWRQHEHRCGPILLAGHSAVPDGWQACEGSNIRMPYSASLLSGPLWPSLSVFSGKNVRLSSPVHRMVKYAWTCIFFFLYLCAIVLFISVHRCKDIQLLFFLGGRGEETEAAKCLFPFFFCFDFKKYIFNFSFLVCAYEFSHYFPFFPSIGSCVHGRFHSVNMLRCI